MRVGLVTRNGAVEGLIRDAVDVAWVAPVASQAPVDIVLVDLADPASGAVLRALREAGRTAIGLGSRADVEVTWAALGAGAADVVDPRLPTPELRRRLGLFTGRSSGSAPGFPLLAIGSSTGGPAALTRVIADVAHPSLAIVVAQHLEPQFTDSLAEMLARATGAVVRVAEAGDRPTPGVCVVARATAHLELSETGIWRYVADSNQPHLPSATRLFASLAASWRGRGAAALLTGMGEDGAAGLLALRRAGWSTFAQDQASSVVYGMPRAAVANGAAAEVAPLDRLGPSIVRALRLR